MVKQVKGCTHLIIRNNKIVNVFTHLDKLPKNGIVHLKGDKIYSFKEFKDCHPLDHKELKPRKEKVIISTFDLPSNYEKLKKRKL